MRKCFIIVLIGVKLVLLVMKIIGCLEFLCGMKVFSGFLMCSVLFICVWLFIYEVKLLLVMWCMCSFRLLLGVGMLVMENGWCLLLLSSMLRYCLVRWCNGCLLGVGCRCRLIIFGVSWCLLMMCMVSVWWVMFFIEVILCVVMVRLLVGMVWYSSIVWCVCLLVFSVSGGWCG